MLSFSDVSIRRGTRLLFANATFTLFRGEKIGITGANGAGKSSLLSLVRGELQADVGSFERPSRLAIAYVAQELVATEQTAIEFVMDGDTELRDLERRIAELSTQDSQANNHGTKLASLHERYAEIGGYDARSRAGRLLHGLGFDAADEGRTVNAFSGGWRVRLNVAQALMCRSDLLLLDEPTNHLDLDAVIWLETWLRDYRGTLMMISHDREFLDRIINRVVNIENAEAKAYSGNYSAFEEQRAMQLSQHQSLYERQQREIAHMMSFVNRFRAAASKARQAQSRLKALERMQRIAPAHVDSQFEFSFLAPEKLPRPLLAIDDQSVGYGERAVIEHISITIAPGDRIALLGRNGAGKSTLTKLLAGELQSMQGRGGKRTEARDLRIGYFAQHQLEQLYPDESPFDHLKKIGGAAAAKAKEQELRSFLGSFGFIGDRVFEPIGPFSGGEKARLVLALVSYQRPNLLLLDEPTNHLDLEMRQALAVALQDYTGAVVLVSHDRHLLRTVADQFYIVAPIDGHGRAQPFDGDLEDYAAWLAKSDTAQVAQSASDAKPDAESADARKQRKREEADRRNKLTPLRALIAKCDRDLERLAKERALVETELATTEIYADANKSRLKEMLAKQAQLAKETEKTEAEWLSASEQFEAAQEE
jgi:ATP-binding cassette, subfamily F, member 3